MNAHLVLLVFAHHADPNQRRHHVDEEHDKEKLHEWVLVCIQVAKAVDK